MKTPILFDLAIATALLGSLGSVFGVDRLLPQAGQAGKGSILAGMYVNRTADNRGEWIKELGGNEESEKAVAAGLSWLERHQAEDGSWANRHLGPGSAAVCDQTAPCQGPGQDFPIAQTGLAVLAFQAGGHFHFNSVDEPYTDNVQKGLDYLVKQQRADGGIYHESPTYMYEHGIATFALAEACAVARASNVEPGRGYRDATIKAIRFIEDNQHQDGGWRYTRQLDAPSDTSISGWQVLALKTAKEADLKIDAQCVSEVREFFRSCELENGRTAYQGQTLATEATTGVGMLVHQFLLDQPDSALVRNARRFLAERAQNESAAKSETSPDYYLWYNCTLAMFRARNIAEPIDPKNPTKWTTWNAFVRESLIDLQEEQKGCQLGSWPPNSRWADAGGRVYTTALATLTLEVYYRFADKQSAADQVKKVTGTRKLGSKVLSFSLALVACSAVMLILHVRLFRRYQSLGELE